MKAFNSLQILSKAKGTPAQERERLLNQVKEDNKEISTMERQTAEVQDKMNQLHEEQSQLDRDLEESQSERNTKYRELRKREETMDQVQGHNNMQNIVSFFYTDLILVSFWIYFKENMRLRFFSSAFISLSLVVVITCP